MCLALKFFSCRYLLISFHSSITVATVLHPGTNSTTPSLELHPCTSNDMIRRSSPCFLRRLSINLTSCIMSWSWRRSSPSLKMTLTNSSESSLWNAKRTGKALDAKTVDFSATKPVTNMDGSSGNRIGCLNSDKAENFPSLLRAARRFSILRLCFPPFVDTILQSDRISFTISICCSMSFFHPLPSSVEGKAEVRNSSSTSVYIFGFSAASTVRYQLTALAIDSFCDARLHMNLDNGDG
mmetsp:Transcript_5603/g.8267  ORF Transcript_5603/g.8267 Transcript_5603/m.8267 type:complete len:239 (+) Transcript_5603:622-1338(+)